MSSKPCSVLELSFPSFIMMACLDMGSHYLFMYVDLGMYPKVHIKQYDARPGIGQNMFSTVKLLGFKLVPDIVFFCFAV